MLRVGGLTRLSATDYPGHRELFRYFRDYADAFGLREHFRFETRVTSVEPVDGDASGASGWRVTAVTAGGETVTGEYSAVVLANGTLAEPNVPSFRGEFTGELMHTSAYKAPDVFRGKRVLIVGAGNSGCDIAMLMYNTRAEGGASEPSPSGRGQGEGIGRVRENMPISPSPLAGEGAGG